MKFHIKIKNGKWEVNGKKSDELNPNELDFMNRFFREVKIGEISIPESENNLIKSLN